MGMTSSELIAEADGRQVTMSDELLEIWQTAEKGDDTATITIVDNRTVYDTENTVCMLVDVLCDDGVTVRIGLFEDGDMVVDHCDGMDTVEDWASEWDEDGGLPMWLSH